MSVVLSHKFYRTVLPTQNTQFKVWEDIQYEVKPLTFLTLRKLSRRLCAPYFFLYLYHLRFLWSVKATEMYKITRECYRYRCLDKRREVEAKILIVFVTFVLIINGLIFRNPYSVYYKIIPLASRRNSKNTGVDFQPYRINVSL